MEIKSDKEYFALLDRIVKGATYLDNPLIKEKDYERGLQLYDTLVGHAVQYRLKRCKDDL